MTIGSNILQRRSYQHLYFFQIRRVGISPDHKEYIYFKVQWREHTEIKVCLMKALAVWRNSSLCRRRQPHASSGLSSLVLRFNMLLLRSLGVRLYSNSGVQNRRKLMSCTTSLTVKNLCLPCTLPCVCLLLVYLVPPHEALPLFFNLCITPSLLFSGL